MKKYKQGMESKEQPNDREMTRRELLKLGLVGGLVLAAGYGATKLISVNPEILKRIEQSCNEALRGIKSPYAVENIHERIARHEKELEERLKDARPISSFDQLNAMRRNLRGDYKLVNDIPCHKGHNWEPIGSLEKGFTGAFYGGGYTIHNMNAIWPERDYVGMFGWIGKIGTADKSLCYGAAGNLKLRNLKVIGRFHIGKLVGYNDCGFIFDAYANGENSGVLSVGGMIGSNYGIALRCSNKGLVKGGGGLIRYNVGYVVDCLSNPDVVGEASGTLIGWNHVEISGVDDFSEHIINSPGTIGCDTSP